MFRRKRLILIKGPGADGTRFLYLQRFLQHFQLLGINTVRKRIVPHHIKTAAEIKPSDFRDFGSLQVKLLRFPISPKGIDIADLFVVKRHAMESLPEGKAPLAAKDQFFRIGAISKLFLQFP